MSYISKKFRYLNEYEIHKALINEYVLRTKGDTNLLKRDTSKDKRDFDVIKENHKFLWNEGEAANSWEEQLAKRYYDKLFKEYCICDLSRYKDNKVALRWRVEQEVVVGKGQFSCANKKCGMEDGLKTWEVNFGYMEQAEKKNALVKIRLCEECSKKLNYRTKKREVKRMKRKVKLRKKKHGNSKRDYDSNSSSSEADSASAEQNEKIESKVDGENIEEENPEAPWENLQAPREKTQEEEIDEYLADLLF